MPVSKVAQAMSNIRQEATTDPTTTTAGQPLSKRYQPAIVNISKKYFPDCSPVSDTEFDLSIHQY